MIDFSIKGPLSSGLPNFSRLHQGILQVSQKAKPGRPDRIRQKFSNENEGSFLYHAFCALCHGGSRHVHYASYH